MTLTGSAFAAADDGQPVAPAKTMTSWVDPATAPAQMRPLAEKSLLLDIVKAANHYVAVGARGNVLLSDDAKTWRQVEVPTRATLTAVAAIDAQVWAVGHDGMILHSADAGEHWQVQRKDPWQPADAGGDPEKGAPLLDVLFLDTHRGFAIGAYSLALQTADGGDSWQPMTVAAETGGDEELDEPKASEPVAAGPKAKPGARKKETFTAEELKVGEEATPHLNAIARTGSGALFIVAERGSAFRSRDNGATWKRLQLPYDGSMFGVLGYEGDHVLAFGLRGHAFESTDLGDHWTLVDTRTELSLLGGSAMPDGGAVIVGANGIVLVRANRGDHLRSFVDQPAGAIATALPLDGHALLLAGENGLGVFETKGD